jgi:hypothetical protein
VLDGNGHWRARGSLTTRRNRFIAAHARHVLRASANSKETNQMASRSNKPASKGASKSTSKAASKAATAPAKSGNPASVQWIMIAGLLAAVAFGLYQVVIVKGNTSGASTGAGSSATQSSGGTHAVTGPETVGTAAVANGVQTIHVDVTGVYNPNVINFKAGIPAEITFAGGQGCTTVVQSEQMGFKADLSSGPQTVKVAPLKPGTYSFACGMSMVYGKVVVQ